MFKHIIHSLGLVLLLSGPASASVPGTINYGEQHNAYLDCFFKVLPAGQKSIIDLLDALVQSCGYQVDDYAEFITNYSILAQNTLNDLNNGGLSAVIAPYIRRFPILHQQYIQEIEMILNAGLDYFDAYVRLEALYYEASALLCGQSDIDISVLAALDIGAHASLYWGPQNAGNPGALKAKWWQVVLGDVAGGIVGGIFGGGVGAVGLGSACSGYVSGL
jgi:hypothetical protein